MAPTTRYAKSGEVSIAYQVLGEGPPDLVFIGGLSSHLEFQWTEPAFRRFFEGLASFSRLILFDKRGTGMSDRDVGVANLEERMDDVRAVMEAAGSTRAAVYGTSEGGPLGVLFAATYPERTEALILNGTFPRATAAPDWPGASLEAWAAIVEQMVDQFPDSVPIERFIPSVARSPAIRDWWLTLVRMASSPGAIRSLQTMVGEIDVREVLPSIRVPTLVLHSSGDQVVPVASGRYIASRIPGARFIELDGTDHIPVYENGDAIAGAVEEFLTGSRHTPVLDRVLTTVVFTDIVASTDRIAEVGDTAWRRLLDQHDSAAQRSADAHSGRLVKSTGDGTLATFDGPARAVRFAADLGQQLSGEGLQIRAGVHTGEVELRRDGDLGGLGVHIAARICALAGPGEILASRTVKDLTAGSGLAFVDRGVHALKGVPEEWQLFAVGE